MCHFITLIAPSSDAVAIDGLMREHGRRAQPIDNPSIAAQMRPEERQYLTNAAGCDCGTVLAQHLTAAELDARLLAETKRLRRKKWGSAKIERWIDDRRKTFHKPSGHGTDSIEQWVSVIAALKDRMKLPYVGLFVHSYRGSLVDEEIDVSRSIADPALAVYDQLCQFEEDQITIFG